MSYESPHQSAGRWNFNPCCTVAYEEACAAFTTFVDPATLSFDYAAVGVPLLHGSVAPALAQHVLDDLEGWVDRLAIFGEMIAREARNAIGPAQLVLSMAEESRGNVLLAEAALHLAVAEAPEYAPASAALARYAIDRGDLRQAIELLRHRDLAHDRTLLRAVENLQSEIDAPWVRLRRNALCLCGSGRKYKHCCQGIDPILPGFRAPVALRKVGFHVRREARRHRLMELAELACAPLDPRLEATPEGMARDQMISDFATFEGDGITSYLDARGVLLPEDERDLLRWLAKSPRRLWRLVDVHNESAVGLLDASTGEMVCVPARNGLELMPADGLLLARVARLPDGDDIVGMAVSVPDEMLDDTFDLVVDGATAAHWASWYGRRLVLHHAL